MAEDKPFKTGVDDVAKYENAERRGYVFAGARHRQSTPAAGRTVRVENLELA